MAQIVKAAPPPVETPAVAVSADQLYRGEGATPAEKAACRLDVYAPAGAKNLPVLVWFHGGGLTGGDKASRLTTALCRALAGDGIVVASANYRLSGAVKYPAYVEDAAAAVAWMKGNAARWGGDPARVFIGGHSAGGYLAALLGSDAHFLAEQNLAPPTIAGIVALSGQMTTHFAIRAERGWPEEKIVVDEAAPLGHASKNTPPFLLIYGEKDMALRAQENLYFAAALQAAGNPRVKVLEMPGRTHGGTMDKIAQNDDPVRQEINAFLRAPASATLTP